MPVSAIVAKELSAVERRGWLFLLRAVYVSGLAFMALALTCSAPGTSALARVGRGLFLVLVGGQFILAMLLCTVFTSESIRAEREQRTLAVLLATALSGPEIVLGKVGACAISAGTTVLATMPLAATLTLYGGVSPGQVTTAFTCLLAALVVGSATGVLFSCLCRRPGNSAGLTFVARAVWRWLLPWLVPGGAPRRVARLISPWYCCFGASTIGRGPAPRLGLCVLVATCISIVSCFWASRLVPQLADDGGPWTGRRRGKPRRGSRRPWWCTRLFWETSGLAPTLARPAVAVYHTLLVLLAFSGCFSAAAHRKHWLEFLVGIGVLLSILTTANLFGIFTRAVFQQKREGTLALLLTTPTEETRLVFDYSLAATTLILPAFATTGLLIVLMNMFTTPFPRVPTWSATLGVGSLTVLCVAAGVVLFLLVGMAAAAICKSASAAAGLTVTLLLIGGCSLSNTCGPALMVVSSVDVCVGLTILLLVLFGANFALIHCAASMLRPHLDRV